MTREWLQYTMLRAASLLAPRSLRDEWLREWTSELWYVPRRGSARFCAGSFADALWLRRNSPGGRIGIRLESPVACLAFLALVAGACSLISLRLPAPKTMTASAHLGLRGVLEGVVAMLGMSLLYLPAIRLAIGRPAANPKSVPWSGKLRLQIFLASKVVLIQPAVLCCFVAGCASRIGMVGTAIAWTLLCRWVLTDQRNRCPECLRLLTDPVRIGTPSQTLLEWYGVESACSCGHGLLHSPEISASHSEGPRWLRLGRSWSVLFSQAERVRQ